LNDLDPYLVAALVAQESTFVADVRSHANAWGLMQLLPQTARTYARKLGIPYSSGVLTDPETNIRLGTAYLADKIREFGGMHLALASYNAGESPVRRWLAERAGVEREEFIDDIPYPETQGYVRKILGTADDYRRLYGNVDSNRNGLDKTPDVDAVPALLTATPEKTPAAKASGASTEKPSHRPKPRTSPVPRKRSPRHS
jgi:soluble lytic murein transglycosylase-like protein